MNKKGFTLIELLAVVAIISIISLIAVPNVIKTIDNNKKDKMLNDAYEVIALAKYAFARDVELQNSITSTGFVQNLNELDTKSDIKIDPDGGEYNRLTSYVNISRNDAGIINYCVYLVGSKRYLKTTADTCVQESALHADNAKTYIKEVK